MCSGTFVTELNVHEDASQRKLTFSLIQSAFMKEFVGSWHVQPAAEGGLTEVSGELIGVQWADGGGAGGVQWHVPVCTLCCTV